jgi:hypothetical protein
MSEHEPKPVAYRYEIQHGPEGEASYAWLYKGDEMIATMKTHHASVVTALQEEVGRLKEDYMAAYDRGIDDSKWLVEQFHTKLAAAEARANAAEQRLKEAVKVLEPFASVIEDYDPWKEGDDTQGTLVIGSVTDYRLTLGDLRDARAFIKEAGE